MTPASQTAEADRIIYLNIAFSSNGIAEYSGNRCVVFISKGEIQRIEKRFGFRAERPLLQSIAGVVLFGLGLIGARLFLTAGVVLYRWEAGFVLFGALGGWLLWEALRRGHYLSVDCQNGKRKLVFEGKVSEPELNDVLRDAARFGYIFP